MAWIDPPPVTNRPFRQGKQGRFRKTPRLRSGSPKPQTLEQLAKAHPRLCRRRWQTWRIKDGRIGPIVWKARHTLVFLKDEQGLPTEPHHLLVCRNPLTGEIKIP